MKVKSEILIAELIELTRQHINQAERLNQESIKQLNYKAGQNVWSALECIEHLNLYGDFYLPEIENKIHQSKTPGEINFKPGLLGNYFAESMRPKAKLNKMKTFKDKNPNGSPLSKESIIRFLDQQKKMLDLLNKARNVSLTKTKTSISISPLLKLRLGDTFKVVIYHNERHIQQAIKALKSSEASGNQSHIPIITNAPQ